MSAGAELAAAVRQRSAIVAVIVHIAGLDLQIDSQLRQRCSWCGATLVDYALDRIQVHTDAGEGADLRPATWPVGAMVLVDGPMSTVVAYETGDPLPDGSCGRLDPAATR